MQRRRLTERHSAAPLAGVVLSIIDARDSTVVQALTDERGAFDIRLPGAGTFSLDAKRIAGRTGCARRPETNARTAALWEDARAGNHGERHSFDGAPSA